MHGAPALVLAALLVGVGIGIATPLGFAALTAAAPEGRLGQTMGAGEVGRGLGAGGALLVGVLSPAGLAFGVGGLAAAVAVSAVIAARVGERPAIAT